MLTYGIEMWGVASTSNDEILEGFSPKYYDVCRRTMYSQNEVIRHNLRTVKDEVRNFNVNCRQRPNNHSNNLTKYSLRGCNYANRHKRYNPVRLIARFQ